MCQYPAISLFLFIFVFSLHSQSGYSLADGEIKLNVNGTEIILRPNHYLSKTNHGQEIIMFSKTPDSYTAGIIVLEYNRIVNFFAVPDMYSRLITAPLEINFLTDSKVEIVFHCSPSTGLYAIYDFDNDKIEYYYCSSIFLDLENSAVIYIKETIKNHFEVYRNDRLLDIIDNIGPIRISRVDSDIMIIELSNGQEKEIPYAP